MTTQTTWDERFAALKKFSSENGHTRVPIKTVVAIDGKTVNLGQWVSYLRSRYHQKLLGADQTARLERLRGWEWGPFRPGPKSDERRDSAIRDLYTKDMTLQAIGDVYGLTRQRVHQIVKAGV